MRDIAVLIWLAGSIAVTVQRAWLGVLALAVFSYLSPHKWAWGFMAEFPAYQILVLVAFMMCINSNERQPMPSDWRIKAFYCLWVYFFITTLNAKLPDIAWPKLIEVSKIYLPFILTLLLINTRLKLFYLIATIAVSFALIGVKGGIWSITSGFAHRVYGPPSTAYYENNGFAIALLMTIPLLILVLREIKHRFLRLLLIIAIPLVWAAALSSWSRGGLLTSVTLATVLLWHGKRKWLILPLAVLGIYAISGALPEGWYERMNTIQTYEQDKSAMTRIYVWIDGWNQALRHPFLGGGFESWYGYAHADWHSAYVEILSDHGFIALGFWLSLLWGTIFSLTRLAMLGRRYKQTLPWITNYATMLRASLLAYATGCIFLGISYWDILYHIIFISVLAKQFALQEISSLESNKVADFREVKYGNPYSTPQLAKTPR